MSSSRARKGLFYISSTGPSSPHSSGASRRSSKDLSDPSALNKLNQRLSLQRKVDSTSATNNTQYHRHESPQQLTIVGFAGSLFSSTFGFNKISFTVSFLFTYILIIIVATQIQVSVPSVLDVYPEKYLLSSWTDLQEISKDFHPYSSHANDCVHDYIFKQAYSIASHASSDIFISVHDDVRSILFQQPDFLNSSILGRVTYYEGNNILVKIRGNDTSLGAVLVSAHFDSVPTAYGATDDGTGIASMLGILRYYANSPRPLRSIILNFNNNEEFGLLGARAFFAHPWSKEVEVFLNLEGAGAGGRSILFRSTNYGVTKHYKAASSPHLNSIFQQVFNSGYINSETDYKIYTSQGLNGLDIAFYKPRNFYHTRRDSITETTYSALSHMFTNALDIVRSMSSAERGTFLATEDDKQPAVYFDIFGIYPIILPLRRVLQIQIVGLVTGPLTLTALFLAILKKQPHQIQIRGWSRGIISLLVSVCLTVMASKLVRKGNELAVMSQFLSPLLLLWSIFLLSNYLILALAAYVYPVPNQKQIILLELFVFLWVALAISTVNISQSLVTGEFIIPIIYYLFLIAVIIGLLGVLYTPGKEMTCPEHDLENGGSSDKTYGETNVQYNEQQVLLPENIDTRSYGINTGSNDQLINRTHNISYNNDVCEIGSVNTNTCDQASRNEFDNSQLGLNKKHMQGHIKVHEKIKYLATKSLGFDWSLQFLIIVPVSVYLVYAFGLLGFEAIRDNAQEGHTASFGVYFELTTVAILLGVLIVPFVHRLHGAVPVCLLGAIVFCGYRTLSFFPLTHSSPLVMGFLQSIDLDDSKPSATVSILSPKGYGYNVITDFPSVKSNTLPIICKSLNYDNSELCSYDGPRPYVISGDSMEEAGDYNRWLNVTILQTHKEKSFDELHSSLPNHKFVTVDNDANFEPLTGEIFIEAKDSRMCTISFNTSVYKSGDIHRESPVRSVTIHHDAVDEGTSSSTEASKKEFTRNSETLNYSKGISDVTVYKLNWEQKGHHLSFSWTPRSYDSAVLNQQGDEKQSKSQLFEQHDHAYFDHAYSNSLQFGNIQLKHQPAESYQQMQMHFVNEQPSQVSGVNNYPLGVKVVCYWGEYDAESLIGYKKKIGDTKKDPILIRKVPAFDEALLYGPSWVSWTNLGSGIVQVKKYVEL